MLLEKQKQQSTGTRSVHVIWIDERCLGYINGIPGGTQFCTKQFSKYLYFMRKIFIQLPEAIGVHKNLYLLNSGIHVKCKEKSENKKRGLPSRLQQRR